MFVDCSASRRRYIIWVMTWLGLKTPERFCKEISGSQLTPKDPDFPWQSE